MPRLASPEPLRGLDGSFTYHTITERLPGILRRVLADHPWPTQAMAGLRALIEEIPHNKLKPLADGPDAPEWERYLAPHLGQTWLQAPWFLVEMYFFRRILQSTGYFHNGPGYGLDPYAPQKQAALAAAAHTLRTFFPPLPSSSPAPLPPNSLADLLRFNLWGNQADLSMWPSESGAQPSRPGVSELTANLLVDEALAASQHLAGLQKKQVRVDFILDNVGPELACDLALACHWLEGGIAQTVYFHVKPYPTYVSDATRQDVLGTLDFLSADADPQVSRLAHRLQAHLEADRLRLVEHYFWVSPLSGWQMPPELRQQLSQTHLIVNKGDANYRRWLGDLHWPFTTPLEDILSYLPAAWLGLRVLKSELAAGLPPGQPEELAHNDPQWLFNGRWGVIQFVG